MKRGSGKDIRFILYTRALESGGLRRPETTCGFGTHSLQIRDADDQVVAERTVPAGGLVSPEIPCCPSHPTLWTAGVCQPRRFASAACKLVSRQNAFALRKVLPETFGLILGLRVGVGRSRRRGHDDAKAPCHPPCLQHPGRPERRRERK